MALEHVVGSMQQMAYASQGRPVGNAAACGNFQDGDTLVGALSSQVPVPGTCPQCYQLCNPGTTSLVLSAMEA